MPFYYPDHQKARGQGSRHAGLQVIVTKSSKPKPQVLSAGNYRKCTPKKAQAARGSPLSHPILPGICIILGRLWQDCCAQSATSAPTSEGLPRGAVGTAQHAGWRGLGALWTGCWEEPVTCRSPWPKPCPVTWRASQGVPSAEGESTGH